MTGEEWARYEYDTFYRAIKRNRPDALCQKCGDIGFLPVLKARNYTVNTKDGGEERRTDYYVSYARCECAKSIFVREEMERSGTRDVAVKTFENFSTDTAFHAKMKAAAMEFLEDGSSRWFVVCGQSGCGKTHICTALMGELIKKGKRCLYVRWLDEVRQIKADLNDPSAVDKLKKADVLYVDDFFKGRERPSEYDMELAFEIINYRYSNGLTTIISTERTPGEIGELDEALLGRIRERSDRYLLNISKDKNKNMRLN